MILIEYTAIESSYMIICMISSVVMTWCEWNDWSAAYACPKFILWEPGPEVDQLPDVHGLPFLECLACSSPTGPPTALLSQGVRPKTTRWDLLWLRMAGHWSELVTGHLSWQRKHGKVNGRTWRRAQIPGSPAFREDPLHSRNSSDLKYFIIFYWSLIQVILS